MSAFAAVVLLAGCTSATPEVHSEPQPTDSDQTSQTAQDSTEMSSEYLDDLYAESLHDGITPAGPGTAYIEVAGERLEFEDLDCTITDEPDRGQFIISAGGEVTGSGHRLYLSRQIGSDVGFAFEEEHVQLSLLVVEDGAEKMSNTMAQHERDQEEAVEWIRGSGSHPLVRVVGSEATASGVLEGVPFAHDPLKQNSSPPRPARPHEHHHPLFTLEVAPIGGDLGALTQGRARGLLTTDV